MNMNQGMTRLASRSEPRDEVRLTVRHIIQRLTILLLFLLAISPAYAQYVRGPRGGCYTVGKSGRRQYVDRSMCGGKSATAPVAPAAGKIYILGPRGGCYYVSPSGRKQYVDHSLCR
jgi:hypothetical protein